MVSLSLHLKRCFEWKISTFAYRHKISPVDVYKRQLEAYLQKEQPYLDYNFKRDDLIKALGTNERNLSAAVGRATGPVSYTHLCGRFPPAGRSRQSAPRSPPRRWRSGSSLTGALKENAGKVKSQPSKAPAAKKEPEL